MEVMSSLTEKEGDSKPLSDKDKQKISDMGLVWKEKVMVKKVKNYSL